MRRLLIIAGVAATAAGAAASTDLSGGASAIAHRQGGPSLDFMAGPAPLPTSPLDFSPGEASADEGAFAIDEALLARAGAASPPVARNDRFSWVFLLIAFAGLTAVFARKRSGGVGLISG